MIQTVDEIVPIPEHRVRYFGGLGRMLLPSPPTIAAVIRRVPVGKLLTTTLLRDVLGDEFEVDGVCPITAKRSLQVVARSADAGTAYWRVIQQNGGLMAFYPGGIDAHAALLRDEGFMTEVRGKKPMVVNFREHLVGWG